MNQHLKLAAIKLRCLSIIIMELTVFIINFAFALTKYPPDDTTGTTYILNYPPDDTTGTT